VIPILESRRLTLRPLDVSDSDAVQRVFPRWEIVQFMSRMIPWPYPADGALTFGPHEYRVARQQMPASIGPSSHAIEPVFVGESRFDKTRPCKK
jgi:hypothetical protein